MTTFSAKKASEELVRLIALVGQSHEPIEIAGQEGNAVLLAEEDWRAIQETLYLSSIPGMAQSIREGMDASEDDCVQELDW